MEKLSPISQSVREPSPTLRDLASILFRQQRVVLITFLVTFLAVLIYGIVSPPYRCHLKILLRHSRIDPELAPVPSQAEFERQPVSEEEVNSEAELLQDEDILRIAVRNTGLISEGRSWFWSLLGDTPERQLDRATRRIGKRLTIEPIHKAAVISVSYDWSDREQGARLLSALASAYLDRHHQVHRPSGAVQFFEQQVDQSRGGVEAAALALVNFTQDQNVVAAGQERDFALQKLSDAEANAGQTAVALAQNSERIHSLRSQLSALPERTLTQIRNADNPELMEKLKSRLLELELKRTELLTQYEPSYRLVQQVDEQIAEAKATIASETDSPLRDQTSDLEANHEWVRSELIKAQVESNALGARLRAENVVLTTYRERAHRLGNHAIEQDRLANNLKAAEEQYLLYVNKREEARVGDALDQGGLLNVTIAEQPRAPALPKLSALSFGFIGLALGSVFSVGLAFVNDYLSPAFRSPEDVTICLETRVLASLPPKRPELSVLQSGLL